MAWGDSISGHRFRVRPFSAWAPALLCVLCCTATAAPRSTDWEWRNPKPAGNPVNDVVWTGNEFVAVTEAGGLLRSHDGYAWSYRETGTRCTLRGIVWTGRQFVAAGYRSIFTSPDGEAWTLRASELAFYEKLAWTGSVVVAVGGGGLIRTSPDGIQWTTRYSGTQGDLRDVVWDGRQLVAVGDSGRILTSPDGEGWTRRASGTAVSLNAVAWTGTLLAAVGDGGRILTSPDGATWTPQRSATPHALRAVAWTGERLVAGGEGGALLASTDGVTWANAHGIGEEAGEARAVAASGSAVVALGRNPNGSAQALTSADGASWTSRMNDPTRTLNAVAWGNQFVAVGDGGLIQTSVDGVDWVPRVSGTTHDLNTVVWTGSRFVAAGANGTVLESGDGATWISHRYGAGKNILGALVFGGRLLFVGRGTSGNLLLEVSLLDLDAPVERIVGPGEGLSAVACTGLMWVAAGARGAIYTSPDGVQWTRRASGVSADFFTLAWTGSVLVAAGSEGTILTSPDGIVWTTRLGAPFGAIRSVAWTEKRLIALCDPVTVVSGGSAARLPASLLTSADGITWVYHYTAAATTQTLRAGVATPKLYVAVGSGGAILASRALAASGAEHGR